MQPQPYRHTHRVTYSDCTLGDHVYYARFLEILEAARGEFMRSRGVTWLDLQRLDAIFPVIECRLRYHTMARYDDLLTVEVWVSDAKGARLTFGNRIVNAADQPVLQAETFHACTTIAGKPRRLPRELLLALGHPDAA